MSPARNPLALQWMRLGASLLPFADAASTELPLGRLLRLSLFQVSVGLATALLIGTLNRVMIVELGLNAWVVAAMVSLPLLFAPFRTLVGHRSDQHRSFLGWRRVPYIWMGSMMQFGGLAIMPFALILLSGDTHGPAIYGQAGAALAFLLVGAGLQTTQTAGLALATDLAPEATRPRVIALLYVNLLVGLAGGALVLGVALRDFSQLRLIEVIQGAALVTLFLNGVSLWKQEPRRAQDEAPAPAAPAADFFASLRQFLSQPGAPRFLFTVALGAAAFSMQEIILEPYGARVLGLSVSSTTTLTALLATGSLLAFALAANRLRRGSDPFRLAACGALAGLVAFPALILSAPLDSAGLFRSGTLLLGFGNGLFSVGVLACTMSLDSEGRNGLALGAWGAVYATATGFAIAAGGVISDVIGELAARGALGAALTGPASGYLFVYHVEIALLFGALVALGPLVRSGRAQPRPGAAQSFGMVAMPG
jgi:BCD family chlorophyll transporter-like MFS transporter